MNHVEIIPAVNVETFEELVKAVRIAEPHARWIHLDVADGTFTKNTIWHNASDLLELETRLLIELHLMIGDIEKRIEEWLLPNISRAIFHIEASKDPFYTIDKIRQAKKEAGLAIAPQTQWMRLKPYLSNIDLVQALAVHPGLKGQEFQDETLDKIKHLRAADSKILIEVDGGMKVGIASRCVEAGANVITAASSLYFSQSPFADAYQALKRDVMLKK